MTALVMAGGKATRMRSEVEKPLLEVDGSAMLQRVIGALRDSKAIDRIIVAVTASNLHVAEKARGLGVEVVETPGAGYESDMRTAIKHLGLGDVMVVSADLPFVTSELVDKAYGTYKSGAKPALSVMCPPSVLEKMNLEPSYVFEVEGKKLTPIGLNILDGTRIGEGPLDETTLVIDSPRLALNVNTPRELELARKLARQSNS